MPPAELSAIVGSLTPLPATKPFALTYPAGDLGGTPSKARFKGKHRINGTLRTWLMP